MNYHRESGRIGFEAISDNRERRMRNHGREVDRVFTAAWKADGPERVEGFDPLAFRSNGGVAEPA